MSNFFSHSMRSFFMASCFFVFIGCGLFFTSFDYTALHKFYFLALSPACAYAGFLLVGLTDWNNYKKSLFIHASVMGGFVFLGFCVSLFNIRLAGAFLTLFWCYLFVFSFYITWLDKNKDQISIVLILFCFTLMQGCYVWFGDEKYLNLQIHLNVAAVILVFFRISMVMCREAINSDGIRNGIFIPNSIYKNLSIFFIISFMVFDIFFENDATKGYLSFAISFVIVAKLKELHYKVLLRHNYIAFYYILQLFTAIGYLWLGASYVFSLPYVFASLHLIAIVCIMGAIYMVFNIAGLRHSGQELKFRKSSVFGIIFIFTAGILRFLATSVIFYIKIPAILIALAFILYAIEFFKIFKNNIFTQDPD